MVQLLFCICRHHHLYLLDLHSIMVQLLLIVWRVVFLPFIFTFHYGSITMILSLSESYTKLIIYIPLWFNYYDTPALSVMIICQIYIPLWFNYYNAAGTEHHTDNFIYIPLWFNYYPSLIISHTL